MDQSPNGLRPPKPPGRANKKPMYMMLGVCLLMALALMYAITAQKKLAGEEEGKQPDVAQMQLAQGQGTAALALPPPAKTPAVQSVKDEEVKPRKNLIVNIGEPKGQTEDPAAKRREQLYLAALTTPMIAKQGKSAGGQGEASSKQTASTTNSIQTGDQRQSGYDPAANIDKEKFFERADTGDSGWLSRHTREVGRSLEIKTGTVIPAVMVSGINSDLPGVMIAQVSQNVYDTATGQYLMIPQGAKLYGMYDSRVVYGQERVLVAWNRVIFPDGSSVTLGAMSGTDMSGYAGFNDKVNNHYIRAYSNAFLMSLVTGYASYLADYFDNSSSYDRYGNERTTIGNEIGKAMAQQMSQATIRMLEKNLNISPTLEIRPGYQFNVVATKDVMFKEPYSDQFIGHQDEGASHASAVRP